MKKYAFCEYCLKEQPYTIIENRKTAILNEEEISYNGREAYCSRCKNEIFVNDVNRKNLSELYDEYRRRYNLIEPDKITAILKRYNISPEGLSALLGFEAGTVSRYIKGDMVSIDDSEALKKIYDDVQCYSFILQTEKDRITPEEYYRSSKTINFIRSTAKVEKKVDNAIKYILTRYDDVTPLIIQKLLYYMQAFNYVFTDNFLFEEDFKAGDRGPFLESVMERYNFYGFDYINDEIMKNDNLKLEDMEISIAEGIIKFYGCYSGKILEKMVKNESPWIITRKKIIQKDNEEKDISEEENEIIDKELISIYFRGIKDKFVMTDITDLEKYSRDIFEKIY